MPLRSSTSLEASCSLHDMKRCLNDDVCHSGQHEKEVKPKIDIHRNGVLPSLTSAEVMPLLDIITVPVRPLLLPDIKPESRIKGVPCSALCLYTAGFPCIAAARSQFHSQSGPQANSRGPER